MTVQLAWLVQWSLNLVKITILFFNDLCKNIYSYYLAEEIGISAEQIRKDLSNFKING